jgi:hypothetical protein
MTTANQTQTRARHDRLQRELDWAKHKLAAGKPALSPSDLRSARLRTSDADTTDPRGANLRRAEADATRSHFAAFHSSMERDRLRGPQTDEEHAFDAAARSIAQIEADLAALPVATVAVEPVPSPDSATLRRTAGVLLSLTLHARPGDDTGYWLGHHATHEHGAELTTRRRALGVPDGLVAPGGIGVARHGCLASTLTLSEGQYYDPILRSPREYTCFYWSIIASCALHAALLAEILAMLPTEGSAKPAPGIVLTNFAAVLALQTGLPTGLTGRRLPIGKDLPYAPPVGSEPLTTCTLHFQPSLGRGEYGEIIGSVRLTETPPP